MSPRTPKNMTLPSAEEREVVAHSNTSSYELSNQEGRLSPQLTNMKQQQSWKPLHRKHSMLDRFHINIMTQFERWMLEQYVLRRPLSDPPNVRPMSKEESRRYNRGWFLRQLMYVGFSSRYVSPTF